MVDTQRTLADLLSRLPDNDTGQIDPQDIRDLVATLRSGSGEISLTAPGNVVVVNDNVTWLEIPGPWALSPDAFNWSMPGPARLRYNGTTPRMVHAAATVEIDLVAGANKTVEFAVGVNGAPWVPSISQQLVSAGLQHEATALHAAPMVVPGDFLSLLLRNIDSLDDISIDYANLFAMDMAM